MVGLFRVDYFWEVVLLKKVRICFVCLGNIVRSPLAENLFGLHAKQRGVSHKYEIDSAGTSDWHVGEPPDARMSRVAARHDVNIDGSARQFKYTDFDHFDLVIPMDNNNLDALMALAKSPDARNKIHLLREFDPYDGSGQSVPDPYYGGIHGFEEVYDIIDRSVLGLLELLEERTKGNDC
jgi:protein-tyrosine phosphatase